MGSVLPNKAAPLRRKRKKLTPPTDAAIIREAPISNKAVSKYQERPNPLSPTPAPTTPEDASQNVATDMISGPSRRYFLQRDLGSIGVASSNGVIPAMDWRKISLYAVRTAKPSNAIESVNTAAGHKNMSGASGVDEAPVFSTSANSEIE